MEKEHVFNFFCKWKLEFGQSVMVVGSHEILGNWDPAKSTVKLEWNKGDYWTGSIKLPLNSEIEYKYVVISEKKDVVEWEPGCNRKAKISEPEALKVMCFNIRYENTHDGENSWSNRREAVLKYILSKKLDIFGLQECQPHMFEYLMHSLGEQYASWFYPRDEDKGEGAPIFYLKNKFGLQEKGIFWYSSTPEKHSTSFGNKIPRIGIYMKLQKFVTNEHINVFNTHYDHLSAECRVKSSEILAEKIRGIQCSGDYTIAMGDLNATPKTKEITSLISLSGLLDTAPEVVGGTFHGWTGDKTQEKIDYIFYSKMLKCTDFRIDYSAVIDKKKKLFLSDHFPIHAEFVPQQPFTFFEFVSFQYWESYI